MVDYCTQPAQGSTVITTPVVPLVRWMEQHLQTVSILCNGCTPTAEKGAQQEQFRLLSSCSMELVRWLLENRSERCGQSAIDGAASVGD